MKEYTYIDENGQTITVEVDIRPLEEFNELTNKLKIKSTEVNEECI